MAPVLIHLAPTSIAFGCNAQPAQIISSSLFDRKCYCNGTAMVSLLHNTVIGEDVLYSPFASRPLPDSIAANDPLLRRDKRRHTAVLLSTPLWAASARSAAFRSSIERRA
jgi:hypothetical protein